MNHGRRKKNFGLPMAATHQRVLSPPGAMTGKLKLLFLISALLLQFVFLSVAVRVASWSPLLESFPHTYHLMGLTLVGMTPWDSLCSDPIVGIVLVFLLVTLHFFIFCGILSSISHELSSISVPLVERLSKRFSTIRASIVTGMKAKYVGPEGESWLKKNLPGWYYKVTLPDQTFRQNVAQAKAIEIDAVMKELNDLSDRADADPRAHALDSLKTVSDSFGAHIMQIHRSMRRHTSELSSHLNEITFALESLKTRLDRNSL